MNNKLFLGLDDIDYGCCTSWTLHRRFQHQPIAVQVLFGEITGAQVVIPPFSRITPTTASSCRARPREQVPWSSQA